MLNGSGMTWKRRTRSIGDRALVGALDGLADRRPERRVLREHREVARHLVAAREAAHEVRVRHDQGHQMRPPVAVDQRLADLGLEQQDAFDPRLAPCCRRPS